MGDNGHEVHRIDDFITRLHARISDRVVEWPGGVAYLNDTLPKIWDVNFLELHDASLSADDIAAHAEEVLRPAGCEHRRVRVADATVGAALEPGFTRLGWETDVHIVMSLRREPNRIVDTSMVQELGDATWPGREEQMRSYPGTNDERTLRQMRDLYDLVVAAAAGRDFAIVEAGKPVSFALVYSDGSVGQIEDIATLEPYRNRGYSWRVLMKAVAESRAKHDVTFLIADDRDWPKEFYSKAGFDPIARHYYFLKRPQNVERPARPAFLRQLPRSFT